jgi:hypothetical protein
MRRGSHRAGQLHVVRLLGWWEDRPRAGRGSCPGASKEDLARLGYDGLNAGADLERWRAGRLNPVTRELIDVVRAQGVDGARVPDIGAGVGAVHVALLEASAD